MRRAALVAPAAGVPQVKVDVPDVRTPGVPVSPPASGWLAVTMTTALWLVYVPRLLAVANVLFGS